MAAKFLLSSRSNPAHPGRAHRHRGDHRLRPDQIADPHRPGDGTLRPRDRHGGSSEDPAATGFAIQCRVTTEDPSNKFVPNHGRLQPLSLPRAGLGIRLDAGTAFSGRRSSRRSTISLLVKVTAHGLRFVGRLLARMNAAFKRFRVARRQGRNIPFPDQSGAARDVPVGKLHEPGFLDEIAGNCSCCSKRKDRATPRADVHRRRNRQWPSTRRPVRNLSEEKRKGIARELIPDAEASRRDFPSGTKQILDKGRPRRASSSGLKAQKENYCWTDTDLPRRHQSLLATRHAHLRHAADSRRFYASRHA